MQFQRTLSLGTKMESYDSVLLKNEQVGIEEAFLGKDTGTVQNDGTENSTGATPRGVKRPVDNQYRDCLLYTSPSPRDRTRSRMPSSA